MGEALANWPTARAADQQSINGFAERGGFKVASPADIESRAQADLLAALEDPLDPGTAVRVATAWVRYERPELAMRAFEQAIGRCRGYAHTPGLDSLRQ